MEKSDQYRPLSNLIFTRNIALNALALLVFAFIAIQVVSENVSKSFEDRLRATQHLLSESIAHDMLTGSSAEAYKKCKTFYASQPTLSLRVTNAKGETVCLLGSENLTGARIETCVYFDEAQKEVAARISGTYSLSVTKEAKVKAFTFILFATGIFAVLQFFLLRRIAVSISNPIKVLSEKMSSGQIQEVLGLKGMIERSRIRELHLLFASTEAMIHRIQEVQDQLLDSAVQQAMAKTASQVAHDIRSPLAALETATREISHLPEEKRIMIRSATGRIRDIANQLLTEHRKNAAAARGQVEDPDETGSALSHELLSSLIEPLISEKRLQFRSRIGIEIESQLDTTSYGLFARIHPVEFKRVLSNLINNSVEAMEEKGMVAVSLRAKDGQVLIRIQDNGKGIPAELLEQLGQKGVSHGKSGGSGLGLYHARTCVESWGGKLDINSKSGEGAAITLALPQAQAPHWFVSTLSLPPNSALVVLDDDSSIHQIWQGRFDSMRIKDKNITVHHFSTPVELRQFVKEEECEAKGALFLTDYELLGFEETGLSLVEELALGKQSILVTSRFEERHILCECQRLGVRMIPKGLAGFVPMAFMEAPPNSDQKSSPVPDAILLDDDPLVRMTWEIAARIKGIPFCTFDRPAAFLEAVKNYPKDMQIYLDSHLGGNTKGEDIAKTLYKEGYCRLFLATGYIKEDLPPMPWIREVVGKEPPW